MSDDADQTSARIAQLEAENARLHERLRTLLDLVPDFVLEVDPDTRVLSINHSATPNEQLIGVRAALWVHEPERANLEDAVRRAATGAVVEVEVGATRIVGGKARYLVRAAPASGDGGSVFLVGTDITDLAATRDALVVSEARLRSGADSLPCAFWVADEEGNIVVQNTMSIAAWGDLRGTRAQDLRLPDHLRSILRSNLATAFGGDIADGEVRIDTPGGPRQVRVIVAPVRDKDGVHGVCGVDIDVTAQRTLEARLYEAAKEESIGRLAGGVAHDFNNILTAILGFADLAYQRSPLDSPARAALERVSAAAQRGADLTGQLLAFARRQRVDPRPLDLGEAVARAARMLPRVLGDDVELSVRRASGPLVVVADPGQIHQIIVNLVINAMDALPRGGRITVSTESEEVSTGGPADDRAPGRYAVISVRDDGVGMPPEVLEHIFEPFFTTKPVGKGTGLGLAVCQGVVRQAGGAIRVRSAPGLGSEFRVSLPLTNAVVAVEPGPRPGELGGVGTVLLVEDDPAVRSLLADALEAAGYTVSCARDGDEAVALVGDSSRPPRAVITDLLLPRMGGMEVAARVRSAHPGTPVILVSGHPDVSVDSSVIDVVLVKPFSTADLLAALRGLLERR